MKALIAQALEKSLDFPAYVEDVTRLVREGKTSGPHQTERLAHYTKLNLKRMERIMKQAQVPATLQAALLAMPVPMRWLVITEAWCGDAAQNIPYLAQTAAIEGIPFHLVYRDENPELMEQFLTNGSRSIPKLIVLSQNELEPLGTWGPRPVPVQQMVMEYKNQIDHSMQFDTFAENVHHWYTADKGSCLYKELESLLREISARVAV
jgi:hypothetical protein